MTIDSHTHILPEQFRSNKGHYLEKDATFRALFSSPRARSASAEELLKQMERSGVDRSIVAGYGWTDLETAIVANDYLLESAESSNGRLIPLCSVNPIWGMDAVREIERCAAAGARGIGELHPDSQNFLDADFGTLAPLFSVARDLNLPILVHTSEPVGHSYPGKGTVTPEYSMALARAFAENILVFAHFGGGLPFYSLMPEVRAELKNVYFDSAAFPLLYSADVFGVAAAAAGAEHVLFASDFPLVSQQRALKEYWLSNLAGPDSEAILDRNARRVWSLS